MHTGQGKGWRGSVVFNDQHVDFADSHLANTKYGEFAFKADNLFHAEGPNDAWMIYAGSGDMP